MIELIAASSAPRSCSSSPARSRRSSSRQLLGRRRRGRGRGRPRAPAAGRHRHGPRRPRQDHAARPHPQRQRRRRRGRRHHPAHRRLPGRARTAARSPSSTRRATRRSPPCGPAAPRPPTSRSSSSRPTTASCRRPSRRINHARAAEVPIVVAITKIDRENADPQRVCQQLVRAGARARGVGRRHDHRRGLGPPGPGHRRAARAACCSSPSVEELAGQPEGAGAAASCSSRNLDPGRGPVVTVLVEQGTLAGRRPDRRRRGVGPGAGAVRRARRAGHRGRPVDAGRGARPRRRAARRRRASRRRPTRRRRARWPRPARTGGAGRRADARR